MIVRVFYFFDIDACNYAYKLLGRLIYSQNIDFQIENEFEQYRYSKKKIIEEMGISANILPNREFNIEKSYKGKVAIKKK